MDKLTQVSPFLYRGSRPSNYVSLVEEGIKKIVDLESGVYEKLHDDLYEKNDGKDYGIEKLHIPCSDIFPPSQDEVAKFLNFVTRNTSNNLKTYVHCLHGKDRTGYMCAAYRMQAMDWSFKDAVKEMFSMGFHKAPYIWWVPFLLEYCVKSE